MTGTSGKSPYLSSPNQRFFSAYHKRRGHAGGTGGGEVEDNDSWLYDQGAKLMQRLRRERQR